MTPHPNQPPQTKVQELISQNTPCLHETSAPTTTTPPQRCYPIKTSCNSYLRPTSSQGRPLSRSRHDAALSTHHHLHPSMGHSPAPHTLASAHTYICPMKHPLPRMCSLTHMFTYSVPILACARIIPPPARPAGAHTWLMCSNAAYPISGHACMHTNTVPFATTRAPALHAAACLPAHTYTHIPLGPICTPHRRAEGKIKWKQQVAALTQGQHLPCLLSSRAHRALMHDWKATVKNLDTQLTK